MKLKLSLISVILLLSITPLSSQADLPQVIPVVEFLDLRVDGSITPVLVNTTKVYAAITIAVFSLEWAIAKLDLDDFGTATGGLTNGITLQYGGINLTNSDPIKKHHDFAHYAFDLSILTDEKAVPEHHLSSRFTFSRILKDNRGLDMSLGQNFMFIIEDDITSICNTFLVIVGGYQGGSEVTAESTADLAGGPFNMFAPIFNLQSVLPIAAFVIGTISLIFLLRKRTR